MVVQSMQSDCTQVVVPLPGYRIKANPFDPGDAWIEPADGSTGVYQLPRALWEPWESLDGSKGIASRVRKSPTAAQVKDGLADGLLQPLAPNPTISHT